MAELLQRMPPNMPMLQYPDTCHPIKGQYPVPWMHWAYAFTYGRSAINPTPHQHGAIVKLRQKEPYDHRLTGFFSYVSEENGLPTPPSDLSSILLLG